MLGFPRPTVHTSQHIFLWAARRPWRMQMRWACCPSWAHTPSQQGPKTAISSTPKGWHPPFLGHLTKATYMLIPGRIRCHSASHSETTVTQASWPPCPHPGLDQQKPRLLGVELDKEVAQLKQLLQDTCGPRRLRTQAGTLRGHTPTRSWLTGQPRWSLIQRQHHQYPAGKPEDARFQAINNKNKLTSTMHTGKTELSFCSLYRK